MDRKMKANNIEYRLIEFYDTTLNMTVIQKN